MFVLRLSDLRDPDDQSLTPICRATTSEILQTYLREQYTGERQDGQWRKYFREGLLEWFRPPCQEVHENIVDVGSEADWVNRAKAEYQQRVMELPCV